MTTARAIISDCLTFRLNRLHPGETLDADLADRCLDALNNVADQWNGTKAFLFREVLTSSTSFTGASGLLGTEWVGLASGDHILGATVVDGGADVPMSPITMAQYQRIAAKATTGLPEVYAHDGAATVYVYPAAVSRVIKLLTRQTVSEFADLDTDYTLPNGYKSALCDALAELMSPTMAPELVAVSQRWASTARGRIAAQVVNPAILSASPSRSRHILDGD